MTKEVKPNGSKGQEDRKSEDTTSKEEKKPLEETLDPELAHLEYKEYSDGLVKINEIPEETLPPVFIEGKPFCIINEKYIPYNEAQIIFCDKQIEKLKNKRKYLEAKAEHEKNVEEQANREIEQKKKKMEEERQKADKQRERDMEEIKNKMNLRNN